ncbi:hypothetical protein E2C01_063097 [Portunus trituberculatus]|uniref:Uncharacterized protein n=1 Tax=Portunus trituberculatus TaxID=210409 RepID=A0A5B7HHU9_PORTR|nr:hypothetical protein [Portunus trituberculatus]
MTDPAGERVQGVRRLISVPCRTPQHSPHSPLANLFTASPDLHQLQFTNTCKLYSDILQCNQTG